MTKTTVRSGGFALALALTSGCNSGGVVATNPVLERQALAEIDAARQIHFRYGGGDASEAVNSLADRRGSPNGFGSFTVECAHSRDGGARVLVVDGLPLEEPVAGAGAWFGYAWSRAGC